MLEIIALGLDGVVEIRPKLHRDERGFFSETWNAETLAEHGIDVGFVQDNHSFSFARGVMRGLHYQLAPKAQNKLIRVVHGAIFDVAVDIRRGSPTFGRWVGVELSSARWNQLLVPKGFAHGFVTLEPQTEVCYKTSAAYSPAHDRAIRFDDPTIGIVWPIGPEAMQLSDKDRAAPFLNDAQLFSLAEAA